VSIDITLLFQLVNFLVSLCILNWLIIRPVRDIIARRRARNAGLLGDAQSMKTAAAQKLESYEVRLQRARADIAAVRDEYRREAEKSAQMRLEGAAGEARTIRQDAASRLREESAQARTGLEARVADFARQGVDRILGA